ncbi:MAG: ATP-binding protein [Pseudomonas sp.]|uniref:ATP-binding protein n=1 Tax=Pseudomonas sp. TaxID=306 RepID=UPI0027329921|nr:ATP-binding protein [Pseudomonas sp.]MDP3847158.1 ATP-binding protein [Pseudomonas sp.]
MNNSSENNAAATSEAQQGWGLLLLDPQLNIRYINSAAAEILLSSTEQATNKNIGELIPALDLVLANASIFSEPNHYSQSIVPSNSANNISYQLELHSIPTDDKQNIIAAYIYKKPTSSAIDTPPAPASLANKALALSLSQMLNINQQLNMRLLHSNRQVLQSEKMAGIGQLAAGVAHEINNPLGFVFSNIKTLSNYIASLFKIIDIAAGDCKSQNLQNTMNELEYDYIKTDLAELLEESEEGLQRVKKIIVSLKDFSHIDEEAFAPADLHKCIETTLSVAQNEIKYKAEIIREFGELPLVDCIASQINQVIMNITVNAAHAIEEFGTIYIRTGTQDQKAWIEIEDNGEGIPEHIISRIFEPFYTTKPIGKGTGLGLSLSQTIIEKHNGLLEVESTPSSGTKFKIWLPIKQV